MTTAKVAESAEERADRLAAVACELVTRLRDDDPVAVNRWLCGTLPHPADRHGLLFVLAAAVPDDRSWTALTAWTWATPRRRLRPHGTLAAAARHRYVGEPLCGDCLEVERADSRDRKRVARARVAS